MRSSKSRSRNKNNNRNRSGGGGGGGGNIINRVFDSSGPEGKVRGTPQQIIDKYTQLMRDAQLSNDYVAVEGFRQHAEHYTRILGVAQVEMDAKREVQEREHRERQIARNEQNQQRLEQQQQRENQQKENQQAAAAVSQDPASMEQPDLVAAAPTDGDESNLVETPEQPKPKRKPRARKPREQVVVEAAVETPEVPETPEAAE